MTENDKLQVFEDQTIRTAWDEEKEEWYFSVVDVVVALTESPDYKTGRKYWNKLKQRLKEEGNELVTNCHQLKMKAADGKRRLTDVANTEQLLRIIQSIPSKKAEPFKMWLAMVGRERIEEIIDPELTIERALDTYAQKGYPPEWINQRLQTIRARKELTDAWSAHGAGVRHVDGRSHKGVVRAEYTAVQEPERAEKGKPARQYEYVGAGTEYVGGSHHNRTHQGSESARAGRKPHCGKAGWHGSRQRPKRN